MEPYSTDEEWQEHCNDIRKMLSGAVGNQNEDSEKEEGEI